MPRASDGPLYGLRRIFNRNRALRLSNELKLTLRAMNLSPCLAKCREGVCKVLSERYTVGAVLAQDINEIVQVSSSDGGALSSEKFHCAGKAGCSPLNLYARVRFL
jgi:hypothetical protein